jgi:acetyltransferase-like isoleucine patch superfamily enzyme
VSLFTLSLRLVQKLRIRIFTVLIAKEFKHAGKNISISPPFRFSNLGGVVLGDRVTISKDCWLQTLDRDLDLDVIRPKIVIGNGCNIGMGATISAAQSIVFGENILLARNVYISDHRHAFENVELPIKVQGICGIEEVSIGANSWIGQNACILPGSKIGRHCVIGSNSVVNRNIPDYSVAAGAPVRIIRTYNPITREWVKVTDTGFIHGKSCK